MPRPCPPHRGPSWHRHMVLTGHRGWRWNCRQGRRYSDSADRTLPIVSNCTRHYAKGLRGPGTCRGRTPLPSRSCKCMRSTQALSKTTIPPLSSPAQASRARKRLVRMRRSSSLKAMREMPPGFAASVIQAGSTGHLVALDRATGTRRWIVRLWTAAHRLQTVKRVDAGLASDFCAVQQFLSLGGRIGSKTPVRLATRTSWYSPQSPGHCKPHTSPAGSPWTGESPVARSIHGHS